MEVSDNDKSDIFSLSCEMLFLKNYYLNVIPLDGTLEYLSKSLFPFRFNFFCNIYN